METGTDQEKTDANRVDAAMKHMSQGNATRAEAILRVVAANTPEEYQYSYEQDGTFYAKFWDQEQFVYFVGREKAEGIHKRSIIWLSNAYGRAHFYLGYLAIEKKEYEEAIQWLDAGSRLEPDQAFFHIEKAKALTQLGRNDDALREYDTVLERGIELAPTHLAVALRGKGAQLIEMGQLDEAQETFNLSLRIDPRSKVARNELAYIRQLRSGGEKILPSVANTDALKDKCIACGQSGKEGRIVKDKGRLLFMCDQCYAKNSTNSTDATTDTTTDTTNSANRTNEKKWWQFWR